MKNIELTQPKAVQRMGKVITVLDHVLNIVKSLLYFVSVLGAAYKLMTAHIIFPVRKESAAQFMCFIAALILTITVCIVIVPIKPASDQTSISKLIYFSIPEGIHISFMIFCFFLCSGYQWFITLCLGFFCLLIIKKVIEWIQNKMVRSSQEGGYQ